MFLEAGGGVKFLNELPIIQAYTGIHSHTQAYTGIHSHTQAYIAIHKHI